MTRRTTLRWPVAVLLSMAAVLAAPQAAMAWKPFTHNYIGDFVWTRASNSGCKTTTCPPGMVPVGSRPYPISQ